MKRSLTFFFWRRTTAKSFAKDVVIDHERKSKGIEDINRHRLNHKPRRPDIFKSTFVPSLFFCALEGGRRKEEEQEEEQEKEQEQRKKKKKREKEKEEKKKDEREEEGERTRERERERERERVPSITTHHTHAPPQQHTHHQHHTQHHKYTHNPHTARATFTHKTPTTTHMYVNTHITRPWSRECLRQERSECLDMCLSDNRPWPWECLQRECLDMCLSNNRPWSWDEKVNAWIRAKCLFYLKL